ncbi:MAG TPA: GxxExxY protein [Caulobacteraceae bacterium]
MNGERTRPGAASFQHQEHEGHEDHEALSSGLERLARTVIDAGLKVHKTLGPGLLESAYESCLCRELQVRGVTSPRQVALPIIYEGTRLESGYRLDLVVEKSIIVEVKSVDALSRLHEAQVLTYLKLSRLRIGILMNFNVVLFKQGLRRLVR